ncbi:Cytochrome P450 89A9-like protein [Drosera capensis]
MANIVKYPTVQDKLYEEMRSVIGVDNKEINEEDLPKLSYLRATVLETLRRHPPGHFVLPHGVTEETELGGHLVPKNAMVNVMVVPIGRDPEVWENPMEFKPERFLDGGEGEAHVFDITGGKEIKMIPFGVGRRICPAYGLAMLHLEYFVANLVWKFKWKAVEGDEVDLMEKTEFTLVMQHPLRAVISYRENKI